MSDKNDDVKELAQKCYEKILSKAIEIVLIILNFLFLLEYIILFCLVNIHFLQFMVYYIFLYWHHFSLI